ncbi:hypothetical protein BMS3Abin09_00826 [bacterium BMS3Abin09]|nr:hypothetical protein BMS3Abin09_00826 [bacterium BMS3Abin09]
MKISRSISFTTIFFIILFFLSNFAEAGSKTYHYNLYWSGIKAGEATLEYLDTPEGFTIKTHAVSSKFISIFYKVDDRAETVLYPDGYPKITTLNISEGRHTKHKVTSFIQKTEETPQKIFFHDILKDEKAEYKLDKPAYDPLSGFYVMTQLPMEIGKTEYISMFDSKKIFDAEINVLKKENISVPAGKFDTIVINPVLQTEGLFVRNGKMFIWLTDDERKIPVMFRSKVKIGSFVAKLAEEN